MNRTAIWKQPEKVNLKPFVYVALCVIALVILWRARHLIYPVSVTTFIRVVAYGVIPLVLAWAGDHFAADVVKEPRKRHMYRAFFIFFAVLGVALIAIVENKVDTQHESELKAQKADTDEQRKNLKAVLNQMPNIMVLLTELERRPSATIVRERPPAPPPTAEERLRRMTNAEFRQYAMDWAKKLRDFETKFSAEDEARFFAMPTFGADQAARDLYMSTWSQETMRRYSEHLNDYKNNFWSETVAIYNEVSQRYKAAGKTLPEPGQFIPFSRADGFMIKNALSGNLNGPHPIGELADYIEILARNLPT